MGAPENFAQVADLLIEAALLPSQLNRGVAGGGVGKKNFFLSFFYFSMCASGECVRGAIVHECVCVVLVRTSKNVFLLFFIF